MDPECKYLKAGNLIYLNGRQLDLIYEPSTLHNTYNITVYVLRNILTSEIHLHNIIYLCTYLYTVTVNTIENLIVCHQ